MNGRNIVPIVIRISTSELATKKRTNRQKDRHTNAVRNAEARTLTTTLNQRILLARTATDWSRLESLQSRDLEKMVKT